jgi:flagellar hook-length control protein FliK
METITPIPQTRLKIPDTPPEAPPENPPEGFAQVMARQKKFIQPQENPMGLEREGAGPKTPLTPEEKSKQESRDPAYDPEVTSFLTTPISKAVLPSPPNRPGEPLDLEDPTLFSKLAAQPPNPALASTEQIGSDSWIQPGPEDFLIIKETGPASAPASVQPAGTLTENTLVSEAFENLIPNPGLASTEQIGSGSWIQLGLDDFPNTNQTGPASAPASVQPAGTLKENPLVSKAYEDLILYPAPESLTIEKKVSPETTEIAMRSSQTTMENSPSFSPQGPAIPETIPILDGPDPSPSLMLRQFTLKGQDSQTAPLEIKPDSQAPPVEALSGIEKVVTAPIVEEPPIAEAGPVESDSQAGKISAMASSPATSKEILSNRGTSSLAKAEGLPDPEKTSPTLTGMDPETSFLPRASSKKVDPGISPQYSGENPAGPGGPEMNSPIRFQEDTALGVMAKFPDQPRIEGVPADRPVEGPPKGSPEWIKEALSVYQQFSKGLFRTLQQSGDRIQMTLDPPELGSILLEINRDRNFVTAHLWTDNPQTKELLDFSRGQLQKTLQLDGFKLDRFEVLVQPDLKSFQGERWFGGRQPDWENNRPGGSRVSSEGLNLSPPETATLRFSQGNQYVDTWV